VVLRARQLRNAPIQLRDRVAQLLLPHLVRGQLELTLHLGASQAAGFKLPCALRISALRGLAGFPFLFFAFVHPLGKTGFRVDESFSGITHGIDYTDDG
jgi:hypothetical protein